MNDTTTSEKVRLTGWGTFEDLHRSILALLFGQMVKRATPVVQEYLSDLYHDAHWLAENVTGPTEFDFLVRTSGTNISLSSAGANSAVIQVQIGAPGGVFYHVSLTQEDHGMWYATFTEVPLAEVVLV